MFRGACIISGIDEKWFIGLSVSWIRLSWVNNTIRYRDLFDLTISTSMHPKTSTSNERGTKIIFILTFLYVSSFYVWESWATKPTNSFFWPLTFSTRYPIVNFNNIQRKALSLLQLKCLQQFRNSYFIIRFRISSAYYVLAQYKI